MRQRRLFIGIGLLSVLIVFNAAVSYRQTRELHEAADWVDHTHEIMAALEQLVSTIKGAETSQRGFLITGNPTYLEPYNDALADYEKILSRIESLTSDNPHQQERIHRLKGLIAGRLDTLSQNIAIRKDQGFDAVKAAVASGRGTQAMVTVQALASEIEQHEGQLLVQRKQDNKQTYQLNIFTGILSALLGLIGLGLFTWLLRIHLDTQEKSAASIYDKVEALREANQHKDELMLELKNADQRKDEFLATLAHELRNPLSPISNVLQLWPLIENDHEELNRLRGMMERQIRQMVRLINDLMDVSRISRGRIQLQKQRVDLRTIISEAVESVQPLIDDSSHRLAVALPAEPLFVDGDVARLTQVFGNILHNSAKFAGRNGVIWIAADRQNGQAAVSIRDNGPGIPKHMLSQIFEMFRQVDQTSQRSYGGLGIGLSLVKQLVELHGGTVEARSEGPGSGSEFIVTLPAASNGRSESTLGHTLQQVSGLSRRHILVVDDVEASAAILAMMLKALGQDVTTANDGESAIKQALGSRPDLVFLDIAMPRMDGYEVARRLRSHGELNSLVLVALTGYGQDEDRRKAIEAGFNHHMVKPASIEGLHHLLAMIPVSSEEGIV
jgi:signal transduction histidine kinase/ActR/RegA family two-component response regulator